MAWACFALSEHLAGAFAGEWDCLAEASGMRLSGLPCLEGAVKTPFPRFLDGCCSSLSAPLFLVGVIKGFWFSPSSKITNCARRLERVAIEHVASAASTC